MLKTLIAMLDFGSVLNKLKIIFLNDPVGDILVLFEDLQLFFLGMLVNCGHNVQKEYSFKN